MRAGNGRYEVGELLGRGGMAEVFDGRSLGSHGFEKRVAIKRILPELAGDQTFTSRLVVEAKLAVALQHANVVQVLDLVRDGQDVFLVMEFINGPTLRRLLQERYVSGAGPLPPGLSTYVLHEAAAGLDYAHCQPGGAVIHADISPSNLLLSRNGEVKLADFGIARREGIARAAEGKWGYMAPEQERGEALSARADLYALGVVLYELLTGVHPFNHNGGGAPRGA
ncbi:MAG TPA: serine/threonine-protein kinase, partial [Kofleriaceae bacterium]|nr:serine/threonine-protein kinase [Kofleriaceae bacterium]